MLSFSGNSSINEATIIDYSTKSTTNTGVTFEFTPTELQHYLDKEVKDSYYTAQKQALQTEIDTTTNMLVTLHTAWILVSAATGNLNRLPGYDPSEYKTEGAMITGALIDTQAVMSRPNTQPNYQAYTNPMFFKNIIQLFNQCGQQFATVPTSFELEAILTICRQTPIPTDDNETLRQQSLQRAMTVIRMLFTPFDMTHIQRHFAEPLAHAHFAQSWEKTRLWLAQTLDIDSISTKPLAKPSEATQAALNDLINLLRGADRLHETLLSKIILERLPGLQQQIDTLDYLLPTHKQAWKTLISALYGIVAWRIYNLMQLMTRNLQIVIELDTKS